MEKDINTIMDIMHCDPIGIHVKFNIPLRTVYSWIEGVRKPPIYVINMMYDIIQLEGLTNGNEADRLEK